MLVLRAALIGFHHVPGSHTGELLATVILHLLDRAAVTKKTGHFTLDNAANNQVSMRELSQKLECRGTDFHPIDCRIPCFPHIINICVKHIIEDYHDTDFSLVDEHWVVGDRTIIKADYLEAVTGKALSRARDLVRTVRASNQRHISFKDTIVTGNVKEWFQDDAGKKLCLPEVELLPDEATRWDSVYVMLNRLRTLRQAIDLFLDSPTQRCISKFKLSPMEWQFLQDVEVILEAPHAVQQCMSGERTPMLSGTYLAFEMLIERWNSLAEHVPHCSPLVQIGLTWADKYDDRLGATNAYAVAMLVDPAVRMSWVRSRWTEQQVKGVEKFIINLMHQKRTTNGSASVESPANEVRPRQKPRTLGSRLYGLPDIGILPSHNSGAQTVEQEFEAYTTANLSAKGTDMLALWMVSETLFPTLYGIAMDYLPIQASAVPCERVFSSSSETDTKKRNRMSPVLMEALQVVKFLVKKERLNFTKGWAASQKAMEYEVLGEGEETNTLLTFSSSRMTGDVCDTLLRAIAEEECDDIDDVPITYDL